MTKILKRLTSSTGIQQSIVVTVGNMAGTGIAAVALILLSRILGPAKFGEFSVGIALATILSKLNDWGLSYAQYKLVGKTVAPKNINAIFSESIKLKLWGSALTIVMGILAGKWLATFFGFATPAIMYSSFILTSVIVLFEQVQTMLQSLHRFTQSVLMLIFQAAIKLIGTIALFLLHQTNTLGALIMYLASPALTLLVVPKLFPRSIQISLFKTHNLEQKALLGIAGHSLITVIATTLIENSDILFVQHYMSSYEAGLFSGVSRLALFFNLVAYSLGSVLNPRAAKYHSPENRQQFLKKAFWFLPLVLLGYLLLLPLTPAMITLSLGSEYLPALSSLMILNGAAFLTIAAAPFVALFFSYHSHWYFSVIGVIQILIILVGNIILVPEFGLEAAAWVRVGARLSLLVITIGLSWLLNKNKVPYSKRVDNLRN